LTVKYATNATGVWTRAVVDRDVHYGGELSSIAVDSSNTSHISYCDSENALKYATNASGYWEMTTVAELTHSWTDTAIATNSEDSVRISHGRDGALLLTSSSPCMDNDNDGYGDPASPECAHLPWDCDDTDVNVYTGAAEGPFGDPSCSDTVDNDCDGYADEEDSKCCECIDNDNDGYGDPRCENCTYPYQDCDDSNADANPGATEEPSDSSTCADAVDNDCDGKADALDPGCISPGFCSGSAEASMCDASPVYGPSALATHFVFFMSPLGAVTALWIWRRKR
jgi:hypothetical protein